jgi:hypothetical protein
MARKTLNASRLQQEVSRRIQRLQEVVDDGVSIVVPRPQMQSPDASGCNWTMKHFGNAAGFEAAIADVLARVRAEYNLADSADEPAVTPPGGTRATHDPFGGASRERAGTNPFGETMRRERVNPFGEAPARDDEHDAAAPPKKPPRDPFASD